VVNPSTQEHFPGGDGASGNELGMSGGKNRGGGTDHERRIVEKRMAPSG